MVHSQFGAVASGEGDVSDRRLEVCGHGAKARISSDRLTARLKPRPFNTNSN
jgi:hypothetical protein